MAVETCVRFAAGTQHFFCPSRGLTDAKFASYGAGKGYPYIQIIIIYMAYLIFGWGAPARGWPCRAQRKEIGCGAYSITCVIYRCTISEEPDDCSGEQIDSDVAKIFGVGRFFRGVIIWRVIGKTRRIFDAFCDFFTV